MCNLVFYEGTVEGQTFPEECSESVVLACVFGLNSAKRLALFIKENSESTIRRDSSDSRSKRMYSFLVNTSKFRDFEFSWLCGICSIVLKADLSKSNLLKLSDDIGNFAESATGYVDNVPATGRFRFRSLLNKLEQQSGELRSNSVGKSNPSQDTGIPAKLCGDIQATVRDLVTVIQR